MIGKCSVTPMVLVNNHTVTLSPLATIKSFVVSSGHQRPFHCHIRSSFQNKDKFETCDSGDSRPHAGNEILSGNNNQVDSLYRPYYSVQSVGIFTANHRFSKSPNIDDRSIVCSNVLSLAYDIEHFMKIKMFTFMLVFTVVF